jgi:hypothetical protein
MNIGVGGLTKLPIYAQENCGLLRGRGLNITAAQAVICCERLSDCGLTPKRSSEEQSEHCLDLN